MEYACCALIPSGPPQLHMIQKESVVSEPVHDVDLYPKMAPEPPFIVVCHFQSVPHSLKMPKMPEGSALKPSSFDPSTSHPHKSDTLR